MTEKKTSFTVKIFAISLLIFGVLLYSVYQRDMYRKVSDARTDLILKELPQGEFSLVGQNKKTSLNSLLEGTTNGLLVHFWGTWCGPCEQELPSFISFAKDLEKNGISFALMAINDDELSIKKFLAKYPELSSNIKLFLDNNGETLSKFGVLKVPETYLFSKSGKAIKKFVGPQEWDRPYFRDYLGQMLNF